MPSFSSPVFVFEWTLHRSSNHLIFEAIMKLSTLPPWQVCHSIERLGGWRNFYAGRVTPSSEFGLLNLNMFTVCTLRCGLGLVRKPFLSLTDMQQLDGKLSRACLG